MNQTNAPEEQPTNTSMKVNLSSQGNIELLEDGQLITRYHYADVPARPYLYPLNAPGNLPVTRGFPMEKIEGETADHPHHRSLWIAHGDVNGVDNWSEEPGHGYTLHQSIYHAKATTEFAEFQTTSLWTDADKSPILTQYLHVRAWRTSRKARHIDFNITLTATEGDVLFGDTKEGGILSLRVASALDVPRGGHILNAAGGVDEADCWGKPAAWCAYVGRIQEQEVGIAILNHPDSFRAPTTWHVRNYGLMTANPFGYAAFTAGTQNGAYLLTQGSRLQFAYRLYLYQKDIETLSQQIADCYAQYSATPLQP